MACADDSTANACGSCSRHDAAMLPGATRDHSPASRFAARAASATCRR
jgi:hypothetical protein